MVSPRLDANLGIRELAEVQEHLIKAQITCENRCFENSDHSSQVAKRVPISSDAKREVEDMNLSRYTCHLAVQNADSAKEVVALGRIYYAGQIRCQDISDAAAVAELTEAQRRLLLRQHIKLQNANLASPAKTACVITEQDFAVFQNHGYRTVSVVR